MYIIIIWFITRGFPSILGWAILTPFWTKQKQSSRAWNWNKSIYNEYLRVYIYNVYRKWSIDLISPIEGILSEKRFTRRLDQSPLRIDAIITKNYLLTANRSHIRILCIEKEIKYCRHYNSAIDLDYSYIKFVGVNFIKLPTMKVFTDSL